MVVAPFGAPSPSFRGGWKWLWQISGANKGAPQERFSMFTSCLRRDTMAALIWFQVS
jgi:hypothetical protein